MTHVLNYSKSIYHDKYIRKIYKSYWDKLNIPKNEQFSVLDIGCGDGNVLNNVLLPLLPNNCEEIIATDIDADMIAYCKNIKTKKPVGFLQIDVGTEELPDFLKNRFSAIFSSMCFMYVKNLRQGLLNCSKMLKTDRDVLLTFLAGKTTNYCTYAEMSKIDTWSPYLRDFTGFVSPFSSTDISSEAKVLLEDVGLKLVNHQYEEKVEFVSERRNFFETHHAMDYVFRTLPENIKEQYMRDFRRILSDVIGVNLMDEKGLKKIDSMYLPVLTLHGRKS